jgi:hypothetical protein
MIIAATQNYGALLSSIVYMIAIFIKIIKLRLLVSNIFIFSI